MSAADHALSPLATRAAAHAVQTLAPGQALTLRPARAGVLHTLSAASADGHVFLPRGDLLSRAAELLAAPPGAVDAAVTELAASGGVVPPSTQSCAAMRPLIGSSAGPASRRARNTSSG